MKSLSEYAIYRLFESKDNKIDPEIFRYLLKLADKDTLTDYVDQLNEMIKNDDAKKILIKAFGKSTSGYKFKGESKNIKVTDLHPSQSEIDINNSLGFPFTHGVDVAKENGDRYYGNKPVSMPFPLITFNSEYILDGHHRWSQTFAFNKDASMVCLDISLASDSDIKKVTPTDMLKITQGFIAAKIADMGGKEIPKSKAKPENNIFKMDDKKIKERVLNDYIKKYPDEANALAECAKLKSADEFGELLTSNIVELKKENEKYIKAAEQKGNTREVMPQTDKGGDNPDKGKTALPDVEGSALYNMTHGKKTSDKILKNK